MMWRASVALIVGLFVLTASGVARACTSFAFSAPGTAHYVAKNYDWTSGDGVVIVVPKGRQASALVVPALGLTDETLTWRADHESIVFTQYGSGLAISGMNDAGLAIETLVNISGNLVGARAPRALLSLQWVQYQLDTSATVDDVVASLEHVGITQAFIPVHFMVCDASGACVVIETSGGKPRIVRGPNATVLANRDVMKDAAAVDDWNFPWPSLKRSSARRYATVWHALADNDLSRDVDGAFALLDDARMPITRWQIVWDLTHKTAHWRHEDARRRKVASVTVGEQGADCSDQVILAAPFNEKQGAVAPRRMTRSELDTLVAPILRQSLALIADRSGLPAQDLASAIKAMQSRERCL